MAATDARVLAHVPNQPGSPGPATATRSFHARPSPFSFDIALAELDASRGRVRLLARSFPLRRAPPLRQPHRSFAMRDRYQPWVDRQLRHRRLPRGPPGPGSTTPWPREREPNPPVAPPRRPPSPPAPRRPAAAITADIVPQLFRRHRRPPQRPERRYPVHTLRCDASHRGRARHSPMRRARLERAPLHTPARHRRRHPTPDTRQP
jgi:hypothetical protein